MGVCTYIAIIVSDYDMIVFDTALPAISSCRVSVELIVAGFYNLSWCSRKNRHASIHCTKIRDVEIYSLMPIIGSSAAFEIPKFTASTIMVYMIIDCPIDHLLTFDWRMKFERFIRVRLDRNQSSKKN